MQRGLNVGIDGPAVLTRLRAERDHFVGSVIEGGEDIPAERRLNGRARFLDGHTLIAADEKLCGGPRSGDRRGIEPAHSEAVEPLSDRVLNTDTVFELPDLPASLAVVSDGAVGIEIAQAMARLDVRVALFASGSSLAACPRPA